MLIEVADGLWVEHTRITHVETDSSSNNGHDTWTLNVCYTTVASYFTQRRVFNGRKKRDEVFKALLAAINAEHQKDRDARMGKQR